MLTILTYPGQEPGEQAKAIYKESGEDLEALVEKLLASRAGYHLIGRRGERPETLANEILAAWTVDNTQTFVWEHDSNSWYLCDALVIS